MAENPNVEFNAREALIIKLVAESEFLPVSIIDNVMPELEAVLLRLHRGHDPVYMDPYMSANIVWGHINAQLPTRFLNITQPRFAYNETRDFIDQAKDTLGRWLDAEEDALNEGRMERRIYSVPPVDDDVLTAHGVILDINTLFWLICDGRYAPEEKKQPHLTMKLDRLFEKIPAEQMQSLSMQEQVSLAREWVSANQEALMGEYNKVAMYYSREGRNPERVLPEVWSDWSVSTKEKFGEHLFFAPMDKAFFERHRSKETTLAPRILDARQILLFVAANLLQQKHIEFPAPLNHEIDAALKILIPKPDFQNRYTRKNFIANLSGVLQTSIPPLLYGTIPLDAVDAIESPQEETALQDWLSENAPKLGAAYDYDNARVIMRPSYHRAFPDTPYQLVQAIQASGRTESFIGEAAEAIYALTQREKIPVSLEHLRISEEGVLMLPMSHQLGMHFTHYLGEQGLLRAGMLTMRDMNGKQTGNRNDPYVFVHIDLKRFNPAHAEGKTLCDALIQAVENAQYHAADGNEAVASERKVTMSLDIAMNLFSQEEYCEKYIFDEKRQVHLARHTDHIRLALLHSFPQLQGNTQEESAKNIARCILKAYPTLTYAWQKRPKPGAQGAPFQNAVASWRGECTEAMPAEFVISNSNIAPQTQESDAPGARSWGVPSYLSELLLKHSLIEGLSQEEVEELQSLTREDAPLDMAVQGVYRLARHSIGIFPGAADSLISNQTMALFKESGEPVMYLAFDPSHTGYWDDKKRKMDTHLRKAGFSSDEYGFIEKGDAALPPELAASSPPGRVFLRVNLMALDARSYPRSDAADWLEPCLTRQNRLAQLCSRLEKGLGR